MHSHGSPLDSINLTDWLHSIGLSQYASMLEENAVTVKSLLELSSDDLKECGVAALVHRKTILSAVSELKVMIAEEGSAGDGAQMREIFDETHGGPDAFLGLLDVAPSGRGLAPVALEVEASSEAGSHLVQAQAVAEAQAAAETKYVVVSQAVAKTPLVSVAAAPEKKLSFSKRMGRAYRKASGGSMLLSIGIHAVILLVGGYLVVSQIAEERKISFGGGDRRQQPEVQHKVRAKPRAATAPTTNKRITTTSSIAKVSLPDMPNVQMNVGPTIAASMGSGGFGAVGNLGGGNMAQGKGSALSKITFFGLRGGGGENTGLIGTFYDLKQTPQRKPTKMASSPDEKGVQYGNKQNTEYVEALRRFCNNWNPVLLEEYFKAPQKLSTTQIFVPTMSADEAPKAFGVEKECEGRRWLIHYKGEVVPPQSGRFRFRGRGDDVLMVRWDGQTVLDANWPGLQPAIHPKINTAPEPQSNLFPGGKWINMKKGIPVKIEILIGEQPGGQFKVFLCLEEEKGSYPNGYPLFQLKAAPILPNSGFPVSNEGIVFGLAPARAASGIGIGN